MPYKLRKAPKRDLYWVVNKETGKKHSKDPLPKETAKSQMRALYASESGYKLRGRAMNRKVMKNMEKFWFGILQRKPDGTIYRKVPSESAIRNFMNQLKTHIGNELREGRYSQERHDKLLRRINRIEARAITEFNKPPEERQNPTLQFLVEIEGLNKLFNTPEEAEAPPEEVEDEREEAEGVQEAPPPEAEESSEEEEEDDTPTSPPAGTATGVPSVADRGRLVALRTKKTQFGLDSFTPQEREDWERLTRMYGEGRLRGRGRFSSECFFDEL